MPFDCEPALTCANCRFGFCVEDRRTNPVANRSTQFRLRQQAALCCSFEDFVPGGEDDPDPSRTYAEYLGQFRANALAAGAHLFGSSFSLRTAALGKVEGDVYELMEAAALWNAAAAWNRFMDTAEWPPCSLDQPDGAVAAPARKVAIVKLPRGYDTTDLFKDEVRADIQAFESALELRGLELGLSTPDIVGVRLPNPLPSELNCFMDTIRSFREDDLAALEGAHDLLAGRIEGAGFLFALAVKRTTRSDRLYQPLFEANVLKFLIERVLHGAAFRFYVHMESFEGADVRRHYTAASLMSLVRGGEPMKAIDKLFEAKSPTASAQSILDDLPFFIV